MNANAQTKESHIVNGLNVDDLFSLIEGVKGDASKATTSWRVAATTWQGQAHSHSEIRGIRDWRAGRVAQIHDRYRRASANSAAQTSSPILRSI
ncbi:hypothetical protein ACFFYR_13985 [Paraburkholderia dipogonis]|uniref:hypothetical protein n=1 Tax=Paraburkholderia dipogonis TaxID=1211383 RepID=UPI0035EE4424